jgi:hypothetical protein
MLGMASVACSVSDWLAWPAAWLNGLAAALLHLMTWIAQVCAVVPTMSIQLTLPYRWLGPLGGTLLAVAFLSQSQSKSLSRLLGVPAAILSGWLLVVFLLRTLS